MITLGFIRHGETDWNREGRMQGSIDIPLNHNGREMAKKLAARLESEQAWEVVYTSPLQRAVETAMYIAEKQKVTMHRDVRIREIGEGLIEGLTEAECVRKWGNHWQQLELGREPKQQVEERFQTFLEMLEQGREQNVLIVSHGSFIEAALQYLCPEKCLDQRLSNTSLTIVRFTENWICEQYNCMHHLTEQYKF